MPPLVSAHRGGPEGIHPPGTLDAIRAATRVGVDFVEFDVRRTPEGVFVVRHDPLRPGGTPGTVTLEDALRVLEGTGVAAHVDLKEAGDELAIAMICEKHLGTDGFFVTTMEDESVRILRTNLPHLRVALSLGRGGQVQRPIQTVRTTLSELFPGGRVGRCSPTTLAVHHRLARAGVLRWARRRELPVLVWTLNDRRLIEWAWAQPQLWAFTTDLPRLALALKPA